jgi:hypothetical protein
MVLQVVSYNNGEAGVYSTEIPAIIRTQTFCTRRMVHQYAGGREGDIRNGRLGIHLKNGAGI